MDQQLANYFFEEAARIFGFLVKEYSFAPPQLDINDRINFATVTFQGHNLALECILDEREQDVDCKVARVVNGRKTEHYAVDGNGVRVREGLFHLLRRRGAPDSALSRTKGLELHDKITTVLDDFARMLKQFGPEILADSPDALAYPRQSF